MKKVISILILVALLCPMLLLAVSAETINARTLPAPTNVTKVKYYTAREIYKQKLPVVRADAQFIASDAYKAGFKPATGVGKIARTIQFKDWETKGYSEFFMDDFYVGEGFFSYPVVYANKTDVGDGDNRGQLVYSFTVDEPGTYEFVFVGAAQIKEENRGKPAKERGFTYRVDEGDLYQVDISKTNGAFYSDYSYDCTEEEIEAKKYTYEGGGENSYYVQMTYYYNLTAELTAGEHTLEYYHLFTTSDGSDSAGDSSRLNYAGVYVQEFLPETDWASYEYPAPEETTAPVDNTTAPVDNTTAPVDNTTTPVVTTAPTTNAPTTDAPGTDAPPKNKGCGSFIGLGMFVCLMPAAAVIIVKKKH